jgi:hypothetical protein
MPPEDDLNTDGTGNETPPKEPTSTKPAASNPTPPDDPGKDWQAAYKGLQRNYDKQVKQNAELQSTADDLNTALEQERQDARKLAAEKDQITTKHVEATEKITTLESKVQAGEISHERAKLIMDEFLELASFEAKGLLPDAQTPEEMRSKFTEFKAALGATVQRETDQKLKGIGTGPTDPKTPEPLDSDQIYNRMNALAGTKDPEERREFDTLSRQWLDLQSKKTEV